jgi:hypothetical protein
MNVSFAEDPPAATAWPTIGTSQSDPERTAIRFERSDYYSESSLHQVPCEREYLFGGGGCQPANALSRGRWTSTFSG